MTVIFSIRQRMINWKARRWVSGFIKLTDKTLIIGKEPVPILQQVGSCLPISSVDQVDKLVVLPAVLAFPLANITATGKIIEPLFEEENVLLSVDRSNRFSHPKTCSMPFWVALTIRSASSLVITKAGA
jgi:hypothetical protein